MENLPKSEKNNSYSYTNQPKIVWWLVIIKNIAILYKNLRSQSLLKRAERNYSFLMFLTVVGLVYIFNSLYAERQATQVDKLQKEIKELKSEFMTLNAKLSKSRKHSEVTLVADTIGLKLLNDPPFKLVVKTEK